MRTFVKPLWNVRHDCAPERTTLGLESTERRYGTGRGYCVTADSATEASAIVWKWQSQDARGLAAYDRVTIVEHRGVPVLMDAPRW
jgi:hypothetical protein